MNQNNLALQTSEGHVEDDVGVQKRKNEKPKLYLRVAQRTGRNLDSKWRKTLV